MKKSDNQIAENIFRTKALENYPEVVYTTTQAIASLKNVIDKALNIKWGKIIRLWIVAGFLNIIL